jgi:uncharacterized cupredoxin-like copper-binding protein
VRIKTALGLVVVTVIATACGGSSMNHTGSSMDHAGGTSSPTAGKPVEVVMKDNSFSPDHLGVKKGETVTFRFTNSGSQLHEAVIGNQDAQAQEEMAMQHSGHSGMGITNTVEVKPGATGELTMTFDKAGEVLIGCHQPGHYAAGMRATVTVSS